MCFSESLRSVTSLKNSGKMHGYSIKVNVQGTTVWLNGSVHVHGSLMNAVRARQPIRNVSASSVGAASR